MIDVFIAEDEAMAREQIKLLVGKFPAFRVVGEAGDGSTASEKIRVLRPDLLFTDIRMPGKNGLELLADVRKSCPSAELVVISGYSDFEYAKGAIQNGCLDYLLKPISPRQFREMMERLEEVIDTKQVWERAGIFEDIVRGEEIEERRLDKYFPFPGYHIALVRQLGLPKAEGSHSTFPFSSEMRELNCIYGRDSREALYLWPAKALGVREFERQQMKKKEGEGYHTVISYTEEIKVAEIPKKVRAMYRLLNQYLILGKDQYLRIEQLIGKKGMEQKTDFDRAQIGYFIRKGDWRQVGQEISKVMEQFKKSDCPLYRVESAVSHLLADLSSSFAVDVDYRQDLEEAYGFAKSMEELSEIVNDYILESFRQENSPGEKIDSEAYFGKIIQHVQENLSQTITLQSLSETYGMSASYMSRLFKKYADLPFNEYLTKARVEKACRLFHENKDYLVKDVANMVGISDQFYFSRLFRSITGDTPTQYIKKIQDAAG